MKQPSVDLYQNIIWEQRASNYRGTVRVKLEALRFGVEGSRQLDAQNVRRLRQIFQDQGCYRLNPENRIPAVIDQQTLDNAMQFSDTTLAALLQIPQTSPPLLKFPPGFQIQCLKGQSRAKAAEMVLCLEDRWWGIDLYLEESGPELRRALGEKFSNSSNLSDGEIYMKICYYKEANHQLDNAHHRFAETSWWSRLSHNKQENLIRLFKDQNRDYIEAFNKLFAIPGVWGGFRISTLKDLFSLRCREQIINYVGVILAVFKTIAGGRSEWMKLADRRTVELLQLRTPGACTTDREYLRKRFEDQEIFPAIVRKEHRQEIWCNLLTVDVLIPSLYTLFEDIKYLKPCSMIMKRLLGESLKDSIQQSMEGVYSGVNQTNSEIVFQETDTTARSYPGGREDRINLGIIQLWLFAARNFASMVKESPRKEDKEPTPISDAPDASTWYMFANLAYSLGFVTDPILDWRTRDPDKEIAREMLLDARKPQKYRYDNDDFEHFQEQIAGMFATAEKVTNEPGSPSLYTSGGGEDIRRRCGRVFERAYENDRRYLFLATVLNPDKTGGEGITALFVRRSVLKAFFELPNPRIDTTNAIGCPFELPSLVHDIRRGHRPREDETSSLHNPREQMTALQQQLESLKAENELKSGQIKDLERDLVQTRRNCDENIRNKSQSMERDFQRLAEEKEKHQQLFGHLQKNLVHVQQSLTKMNMLQAQNDSLSQEVAQLQEQNSNQFNEVAQLRDQNNSLSQEVTQLQEQNSNQFNGVAQLRDQNNSLSQEVAQLQEQNSNQFKEVAQLRDQNNSLSQEVTQLREKLTEVNKSEEQIQVLCTDLCQARENLESHNIRENELETEVKALNIRLHDLSKDNGQAQDRINELRRKNDSSQDTISRLSQEMEGLKQICRQHDHLAAAKMMSEQQLEEVKNLNATIEKQLKSVETRNKSLHENLDTERRKLSAIAAEAIQHQEIEKSLSAELSKAQDELKHAHEELEQLRKANQDLQERSSNQISTLMITCESHRHQVEIATNEMSEMRARCNELGKGAEKAESQDLEIRQLKEIIGAYQEEQTEKDDKLRTVEMEISQLKDKSISELLSTQKELQQTKKDFEELRTIMSNQASDNEETIRKDKELRQEAVALQSRIAELENEVEIAKEDRSEDVWKKLQEMKELQDEIKALKIDIQWLQKQNTAFEDIQTSKNLALQTIQETEHRRGASNELSELITFIYFENDGETEKSVQQELLTASQLRSKAIKLVRSREVMYLYTVDNKALSPGKAFETIKYDGTYTIHVRPAGATVNGGVSSDQDQLDRKKRVRKTPVLRTLESPDYPADIFKSLPAVAKVPDSTPVATDITSLIRERDHDSEEDDGIL